MQTTGTPFNNQWILGGVVSLLALAVTLFVISALLAPGSCRPRWQPAADVPAR